MYYEIDEHLESDYEDRYLIEDDDDDSDIWEDEDEEDDPDMYPKDVERDQLDYPHNQHIPSYSE